MLDKDRDLFRLKHIDKSISKIIEIVTVLKNFHSFKENWVNQDAMIRNFEIIGEAANHISQETKSQYAFIEWHKIRGMRNLISHEYFGIKLEVIWNTAVNDIPKLKQQISI